MEEKVQFLLPEEIDFKREGSLCLYVERKTKE